MPEIARFYGIIIKLFFGDHPRPHSNEKKQCPIVILRSNKFSMTLI